MELLYSRNLWNINNNDMDKNTDFILDPIGHIYTLNEIVKDMSPVRKQCWREVNFSRLYPEEWEEFERHLLDTMELAKGIGLAANQLGFDYRAFAMGTEEFFGVIYNPQINRFSSTKSKDFEGCLSIPDKIGLVSRYDWVEATYETSPHGMRVTKRFNGLDARVFQHDLDHLNGVVISDYWTDNDEWALISEMKETWEGYEDLEFTETTL